MNERIRQLAKQAGFHFDEYNEVTNRKAELLAELLIRECITQCENVGEIAEQTNHGEMARKTKATSNGCAQMIKWRFGLE